MTQTYAISKAFAIGMVMEILWMCCHHCWLSRFPLANWSPWLEWSSRSRELSDLKPTKTNHSSNQTSWYSVIHFPYYNINFYSTNLRMQNSETQLHIKVIPSDPEVIVLVRWGPHVKEQHHITKTWGELWNHHVTIIGSPNSAPDYCDCFRSYRSIDSEPVIWKDNMKWIMQLPWHDKWVAK